MPRIALDPIRRTLAVDDVELALTERECELMSYLLRHRDSVVTREQLEREVWGMAPGVRSEAVPVAVRSIRRRMGPAGVYLATIRGKGWRLHAGEPSSGAGSRDLSADDLDALEHRIWREPGATCQLLLPHIDLLYAQMPDDDRALWLSYLVSHLVGPVGRWYEQVGELTATRPFPRLVKALVRGRPPWDHTQAWQQADETQRVRARFLWATSWRPRPRTVPDASSGSSHDDPLAAFGLLPQRGPEAIAATEALIARCGELQLLRWLAGAHLGDLYTRAGDLGRALDQWDALLDEAPARLAFFRIRALCARADLLCMTVGPSALRWWEEVVQIMEGAGMKQSWGHGRLGVWYCLFGRGTMAVPFLRRGEQDSSRVTASLCTLLLQAVEGAAPATAVHDDAMFPGELMDGTPLALVAAMACERVTVVQEATRARATATATPTARAWLTHLDAVAAEG